MENQKNWSERVEDLIDGGNIEEAISLLESTISNLETLNSSSPSSDSTLCSALTDLANLYSSRGLSTKSDELLTRAIVIKHRPQQIQPGARLGFRVPGSAEKQESEEISVSGSNVASTSNASASASDDDDDWEAVADRGAIEVFSPATDDGISKLSLEDTGHKTPKRRGRGSFLYKKNGLYSDKQSDILLANDVSDDEVSAYNGEKSTVKQTARYGTDHVLVLADFPPSTTTTDLEKLLEKFIDRGVVIRWVNDTVALAVFRTPSVALEAQKTIYCRFTVRLLSEDDSLLSSISKRDVEPAVPRPKTSARTAERLIAQGMGMKLSTTAFGSSELRKQEEARRNRILTRQTLRDDAWGGDDD